MANRGAFLWLSALTLALLGGCASGGGGTAGTGGTGGSGAAGGTAGTGGGTGGETTGGGGAATTGDPVCDLANCPPPSGECKKAACAFNGQCSEEDLPNGAAAVTQTTGDCKINLCQNHVPLPIDDDRDFIDDGNECTFESCIAGVPNSAPAAAGAACAMNGKVCDGMGACVECAADPDCTDPQKPTCSGNTCVSGGPNGAPCASAAACASGFCVDAVCCMSACTGLCYACSMAKTASADGTCAPVSIGTDPDNECPNTDCDGAGLCQ